jgi:alkylation response protein AidB-like acyl-CoA dehydrogenase
MGTEEQKQKYLPRAAKGELIGAFAITEPSGATNLPAHTANAVKNGSDWILNGAKIFCTNSEAADVYIFCARVDDNVMPTTFIVERGTPGFTFGKKEEKLGWHGSNTGTIYLKDVRVSDDQRLGGLHQGLAGSYIAINESCVGIGAMCVGSAKGVFKKTLEYVKNRELWGKLLIDVQGVYDSIARMGMDIEVSSAFVYKTAAMIDAGQLPLPKTPMSFYTDACKVNPPEMAVSVCDMAIQLHGGNGYMNDLDIHRYWRDVRACLIGEGPTYRHLESMSIVLKNNNIF